MANMVNLNEVGSLTQSGKHYAGTGEDSFGNAKSHQANMEGVQSGFKGLGGTTFQGVSAMTTGNTAQLAKHMADQAARAVLGEKDAITGDEGSHQDLQAGHAANESLMQYVARPLNA